MQLSNQHKGCLALQIWHGTMGLQQLLGLSAAGGFARPPSDKLGHRSGKVMPLQSGSLQVCICGQRVGVFHDELSSFVCPRWMIQFFLDVASFNDAFLVWLFGLVFQFVLNIMCVHNMETRIRVYSCTETQQCFELNAFVSILTCLQWQPC